MTQRGKLAAAVTLLAIVAAGWFTTHSVLSRRSVRAVRDPRLGQQRAWSMRFAVQLTQPGQKEALQMQLVGDWQATLSAARAHDYDVAYQIANTHVTGGGITGVAAADVDALERRLSQRFWVTYRNDGTAVRMHFPRQMDPSDRNLLQMIATDLQLVRPDGAKALQWTALERDGAGRYLAAYQRTAPGRIVKRKLKYTDIDAAAGNQGPGGIEINLDRSERTFLVDAEDAIESFDGSEQVRIGMPMGRGGFLDIGTSMHLSAARHGLARELAGSLERAGAEVESVAVQTHSPDPERVLADQDRQLLVGYDAEQLLTAAQAPESLGADPLLPARLAALLRQRPAAIAPAEAVVRKHGSGNQMVTGALGAAGTPASIAALGRLARDAALANELRIEALTALVRNQEPGADAMRLAGALLDDADGEVRRAAALSAGALARAGRSHHAAESGHLDQALLAQYRTAPTVERRSELLAALGNSVGPTVVPVIQAALRDDHPAVRAAAARALRLAEGGDADELLSAAMTSDRDPGVRAAAIFAAGFRPIGPLVDAVVTAATGDAVDFVRADAVSLLKRHRDGSSKVGEALAQVAAHDEKPGVRRLAKEALQ